MVLSQPNKEQIRVLLVDDQALFRRGIHSVLENESDIFVVAEAHDGQSAINQVIDFAPDVVLMDVRMPDITGIEAARSIKAVSPTTAILILTISDEEDDLYEAVKAGANGYLLKESSIATVADAIRAVMQGESFLSPSMASKLLLEFNALVKRQEQGNRFMLSPLTPRECEVLRCVAKGNTNREIADQLTISENTVKNHVRNILEKLHLHDRMEAAMFAIETNILDVADSSIATQSGVAN